jgi:predicted aspartyl protease
VVERFPDVPDSAAARITEISLHWAPDKRNSLYKAFLITQMIEGGPCGTRTVPLGRAVPGMRRSNWRQLPDRALLAHVLRHTHVLLSGCLLGIVLAAPLAADTTETAAPVPKPPAATPTQEELTEVIVQTTEPKFVAPTRRDRIGRIWAPVLIDGKGPYRLVLDTGANHSAITARTAQLLGTPPSEDGSTVVTGFTGSAVVPTIRVGRMEVGDLLIGPAVLPVLADVFGGAQGVLGIEGLADMRIFADFGRDRLVISRSHGERASGGFNVVPLTVIRGGLLVADVRVGTVRAKAIIDTGAQGTVGNLALRNALVRHRPGNTAHEDIIGVTLDVQGGDNIQAPDIDFGLLTIRGVRVTFGDMYLFKHWKLTDQPTLTLGMDLLGSFDVLIIDYHRHELQIRLRGS